MLLLIDAGNTRIKWAVLAESDLTDLPLQAVPAWLLFDSVSHAESGSLPATWKALAARGILINRILISNVAGSDFKATLTSYVEQALSIEAIKLVPEFFASTAQIAGVKNSYRNPAQLGCDRFATAIAAHALYPQQSLIVATCGTATTIDALSADGVFHGGMILPGLKLMAQSLAKNTAQLPQVAESISLTNLFADHTESAIVSGCINAQVGALERAVTRWQALQNTPVTCLISGGAAPFLLPHLTPDLGIAYQHVDNLVLTGLAVIASMHAVVNSSEPQL